MTAAGTIAIVSFRLGGADGVSVEAAKWRAALAHLGRIAGGQAGDVVVHRSQARRGLDFGGRRVRPGQRDVLADGQVRLNGRILVKDPKSALLYARWTCSTDLFPQHDD
jgi:hypothetical protein